MGTPIRWDNVDAPSGISANVAMRNGIESLMASMDAGVDAMNAPQDARMRDYIEQLKQGDITQQGLNQAMDRFTVNTQQQKFDADMARNALLNQKTAADLSEAQYTQGVRDKTQGAFEFMSTPEVQEQAWVPAKKAGESGHWDEDIATTLWLKANPGGDPRVAMAAARLQNDVLGDTTRETAAVDTLKHTRKLEEIRAKPKTGSGTSGYNTQGVQADTVGWDTDESAQADLDNNATEYIKKGLPKELVFKAIRESLNFRGAYNDRRGLPALEAALQKYKSKPTTR